DDAAHAAGHEGEVGDAEDDGAAAHVAAADDGGVVHAGLGLLGPEALGVGESVVEAERVAGPQVGEPLLEALLVEELGDALAGGQVEVVLALRADVESGLHLLAEDGGLALGAADPQPFGDAAFHARGGRPGADLVGLHAFGAHGFLDPDVLEAYLALYQS